MGYSMIRTDAPALSYYGATLYSGTKVHLWGTQQMPGCSGSPNIVNFGRKAKLTLTGENPPTVGSYPKANIVVGATSFGNFEQQRAGSSMFGQTTNFPNASYGSYGAGNIGALVQMECGPTASGFQGGDSKGACRL